MLRISANGFFALGAFDISSNKALQWSAGVAGSSSVDTGFSRLSAGVLALGNGRRTIRVARSWLRASAWAHLRHFAKLFRRRERYLDYAHRRGTPHRIHRQSDRSERSRRTQFKVTEAGVATFTGPTLQIGAGGRRIRYHRSRLV